MYHGVPSVIPEVPYLEECGQAIPQSKTQQRFLSLETTFETKMEALMMLAKFLALPTQPPQPPVIHVVAGERVDFLIEGRVSPRRNQSTLEECEQAIPQRLGTLVVGEQSIPQSSISKALAAARRATASASVLLGTNPKDSRTLSLELKIQTSLTVSKIRTSSTGSKCRSVELRRRCRCR